MKSNYKIFSILMFSFILVVFFQNCNKVQMKEVSSASEKAAPTGTGVEQQREGGSSTSEEDDEDEAMIANCNDYLKHSKEAMNVGNAVNLSDIYGNLFIKGDHIGSLSRIYGNFHALGTGANSSIESISASYGNMIICGMDVKSVKNYTSGNLVIVQGDVGDIDGFHGNLRLVGGHITGTVKNANGNLSSN